ncbi:hypothetical protein NGRA_1921 [Nosema granulosis]|uniref:Uncharacterized protein n=1 Tax=Nosema granulosis TaxID=83296 RepID=A0A9P6H0V3_9MICR|nr:hypothetical protein NGRA_1921 [Nosema granulosis]
MLTRGLISHETHAKGHSPQSPATPVKRKKKNSLELYFMSGYDNLISKKNPMKRPEKTNENRSTHCNNKTVKVELEIPGVKINLTKEIIIVDNIRKINMITWFRDLDQIAGQNKWSEEQLLEILPYLVSD